MIHESLKFLCSEVNKYLNLKISSTSLSEPRLVLGNINLASDNNSSGYKPEIKHKAVLSLVNVEEDKVAKQQEYFKKSELSTIYKAPPIHLNLYVLFAMNRTDYDESLRFLATIIQFFQYQQVFTPATHPSLDSRVEKLIVDLYNLNFEQTNHLWSVLGGKYYPSVMYKVRQLTIDEDMTTGESGFIKEIQINDTMKMPLI